MLKIVALLKKITQRIKISEKQKRTTVQMQTQSVPHQTSVVLADRSDRLCVTPGDCSKQSVDVCVTFAATSLNQHLCKHLYQGLMQVC